MRLDSAAVAAAFWLALGGAATAEQRAAPTVSVVGVAEEEARPDMAVVVLNVTDDRPNANDAANENARIATAVVDGLKGSGVDAKDIATVGLNLVPLMSEQRDPKSNQVVKYVVTGFRASNVLRVRVHEIDRTGALIAASVQNGALYQGLTFDLSDREAREDSLRVKAVGNAMHRAALYAEGAAMKLGALKSLGADSGGYPPQPMSLAFKAASAPAGPAPLTIEPGVIALSQSVNATWELAAPP